MAKGEQPRETNTELAHIEAGEGTLDHPDAVPTPQTGLAFSGGTELIKSAETQDINEGIKARET